MREVLYQLQNRIQKAKRNIEGICQAMKVSPRRLTRRARRAPRHLLRGSAKGAGTCCLWVGTGRPCWPLGPLRTQFSAVLWGSARGCAGSPLCQAGARNKGRKGAWRQACLESAHRSVQAQHRPSLTPSPETEETLHWLPQGSVTNALICKSICSDFSKRKFKKSLPHQFVMPTMELQLI